MSRILLTAALRTELPDDMVFEAITFPFDAPFLGATAVTDLLLIVFRFNSRIFPFESPAISEEMSSLVDQLSR